MITTGKAVKGEEVSGDVVQGKMANLQDLADNKLKVLLDLVPGANEVSDKMKALGMIVDYVILLKRYHIKAFHEESTIFKVRDRMTTLLDVRANAMILQDLLPERKEITDEVQLLGKIIDYIILLKSDNKIFDGEQKKYMAGDRILKFNNKMMAMLNDLVPGCNKVTCTEQVFEKTINYIELLKRDIEAFYGETGKHRIRAKLARWQDTRNKLAILQDLVPGFIGDIDGAPVFDKLIDYIRWLKLGNEGIGIPFHPGMQSSSCSERNVENHIECPSYGKRKADHLSGSYKKLYSKKIRILKHLQKLPPDTDETTVLRETFHSVVRMTLKRVALAALPPKA